MDAKNLSIVVVAAALAVAALGLRGDGTAPGPTDLVLAKSGSAEFVANQGALIYTISVRNAGDNDASGVVVTDRLPPNVAYVSATSTLGSCSQAADTVTCDLGRMDAGASARATIFVRAEKAGTATTTATVESPDDTDEADNADSVTTHVGR
jgi:uncharacterized repeat protein (TIGR01451 family)